MCLHQAAEDEISDEMARAPIVDDGFSSQVHQKPLIEYMSFSYDKLLVKTLVILGPRTGQ